MKVSTKFGADVPLIDISNPDKFLDSSRVAIFRGHISIVHILWTMETIVRICFIWRRRCKNGVCATAPAVMILRNIRGVDPRNLGCRNTYVDDFIVFAFNVHVMVLWYSAMNDCLFVQVWTAVRCWIFLSALVHGPQLCDGSTLLGNVINFPADFTVIFCKFSYHFCHCVFHRLCYL